MTRDSRPGGPLDPPGGPFAAWALALVLLLYVLPLTLDIPLLDPDEGLHAAIAREMAERGDYVTPRFLGEPFLDKPVLFFWAQAAAVKIFGPREEAIRSVGLAFGLLGVLTTAWLGGAMFGRTAGRLAGACYATMVLPLAIAQAAVHDIALVPWINAAVLSLWRACRAEAGHAALGWAAVAGLWLGLAVLTKGLVGVAIAGVAIGGWVLVTGRLRAGIAAAGLVSVSIAAAVAAPWYFAAEQANPGYLHYFFVERHLLGYATETQRHANRPWWYYVPIVAGGGLPWALYAAFPRGRWVPDPAAHADARDSVRLLWVWVAGGLLFLSLAGSKLVTYVLPLFPPLALLAAVAWSRWIAAPRTALPRGAWLALAGQCAVMAVATAAAPLVVTARLGVSYALPVAAACGVVGICWAVAPLFVRRRRAPRALVALLALMMLTGVLAAALLLPPVARLLTARELAAVLNQSGEFPPQLWVLDDRLGSVVFYLSPPLRSAVSPARIRSVGGDALMATRNAPPGTLIAVPLPRVERLGRVLDFDRAPFTSAGRYRLYTADAWKDLLAHLASHAPFAGR